MPEFKMPTGKCEAGFNELTPFIQGYIEAMFFTDCNPDSEDLEHATYDDFAGETLLQIINDCQAFQRENAIQLSLTCLDGEYDIKSAGRDYWFTRNGHGVGFWNRDLETVGDELTYACEDTPVDLYVGDDGLLYLS